MSKRTTQGYGWNPDLPDKRDLKFRVAAPVELPPIVDLRPQCPPIYDQDTLGSCTANAIAAAFDFERNRQGLPFMSPSRLFIYFNERVIEDSANDDAGAQLRDGISVVVKQGVCAEKDWPYDISLFARKPSDNCFASAVKNEAVLYRRLSESLSDMLQCLASGLPFVFGFTVYESFESNEVAKTGMVPMPAGDEEMMGGHAVLCVGYDLPNKRFLIRNSWNTDWGIAGYCWMPFGYLTDPNLADDRWCISQVMEEVIELSPAPIPDESQSVPVISPAPISPSIQNGIPNFAPIDAALKIYRGAQPVDTASWDYLKSLGVTQVIKLNTDAEGSDEYAASIGMQVTKCPITLMQQLLAEPDLNSLKTAVAFIFPGTFVHCGSEARTRHALLINDEHDAGGNDRTGVCVGLYRVASGWPKERARWEMMRYGFHPILLGLDRAFEDLA